MPSVRCRYYDADGNPIDGGCWRLACPFIHPSDPTWQEARTDPKGGRGRGSSRGMGRGSSPAGTGWSGKQRESTSSWGQVPPTTSVWGGPSSSWGEPAGAGTADPWKPDSVTKQSSWASVSTEQQSSGGGASTTWNSYSSNNVQTSSWTTDEKDTTTKNAGDSTANSGWGQTGQWESVGWSVADGGGDWGDPQNEPEGQVTEKAKDPTPPPPPRPPAPVSAGVSSPRQPSADALMRDVQENPPSAHATHGLSLSRPVSPAVTETTIHTLSHKPVGPQARRKVWKETVKYHTRAVRAQQALLDAEERRDRYKRAQASDIYVRAGPLARAKLDNTRKEYEQRVVAQSKQLESYLKVLQNVPEIDRSFLDFSSLVDEKSTASYVAEAKEWIEQIRPLLIQITAPAPQPSPAHPPQRNSSIEDGQISEDGIPKKRRRESTPQPPHTIWERFVAVEERVRELADEVHHQHVDNVIKDGVDRMTVIKLEEMRQAGGSKSLDPVERLLAKDNESGQMVVDQSEKVAFLLTKQHTGEARHNALVEENKALVEQQASIKQDVTAMQKELDENSARSRELSQKIQMLLNQRHTTSFTLSEAALSQVGFIAKETFSTEVSPKLGENFEMINEQIANNDEQMIQILWAKLDPALKLVERLTHWLDLQIAMQST